MVQTFKRPFLVLTVVAVAAAVVASTALAAPGHGRFGMRGGVFGMGIGMGMGGFGPPGGPGFGGPRGGGAGVLAADVLTPAASFLGVTPSTLAADLKSGKTLADEATAKGKTAAALVDAIVAAQKTVLDTENAADWITDAQETSLLDGFKTQVTSLVNTGPPVPPTPRPGLLTTAASYLGISVTQLRSDLQSGKTLADEATANGKAVDGLVAALTAPAKTRLDAAVTAGTITAAQEQTILADITKRTTDLVNHAKPGLGKLTRLQALFRR